MRYSGPRSSSKSYSPGGSFKVIDPEKTKWSCQKGTFGALSGFVGGVGQVHAAGDRLAGVAIDHLETQLAPWAGQDLPHG